ncbi:hypothetical protein Misp03_79310 [Microbispora sp. NBRC 16548]|nr:hypothetical protein Misp03_79310 [Microbispora sp. NBRC 16548]
MNPGRSSKPRQQQVTSSHGGPDTSQAWPGGPGSGHLAIEAARAAGRSIVMPLLGRAARYVGEADAALKRDLLSRARCLVFPVQWEEPSGMVMIEAMACGTPVVALSSGAVPEVVLDGVTGRVRHDVGQLPIAVEEAGRLEPAAVRAYALQRFDLPVMIEAHERVYQQVFARIHHQGRPAGREG